MARSGKDGQVGPRKGGSDPPCMDPQFDAPDSPVPSWVQPRANSAGSGYLAARDDEFRRRWPTVFDFISLMGVGGKSRKTGTMLLFLEDGKWKACINDRDGGFYCFLSSDSFWGLLDASEASLKEGGCEWRLSKGGKGR